MRKHPFVLLISCLLLVVMLFSSCSVISDKPGREDSSTESEKEAIESHTETEPGSESEPGQETEKPADPETEKPTDTETERESETLDPNALYHIYPACNWGNDTKGTAEDAFTMGNSVNAQNFAPIDVSMMKYLELDLYVPDVTNLSGITTNTQFEITSSGVCDQQEFNWTGGTFLTGITLVNGWNHIKKILPSSSGCDMTRVNFLRWYWVSPNKEIPGCKIANLCFTNDESIEPPRIDIEFGPLTPFIPQTVYETEDVPVALIDITKAPYSADSTGKLDVTDLINMALRHVYSKGGGTVWMPAGTYLISGQITVPAFCTLRGDWQNPEKGTNYGTVIIADVQEAVATNDNGLFMLGGAAGVNGLTVYYPKQSIQHVRQYPFTFYFNGKIGGNMLASVTNCTVLNGYKGIGVCTDKTSVHEMMTIDHFYGTFFHTGAELRNSSDVGTCKTIHIGPQYWVNSPYNKVGDTEGLVTDYLQNETTGLLIGDLEWTEFSDIVITSCCYGIHIVKGERIDFAGSFFDTHVTDTLVALQIDAIDNRWGMTVANSNFEGDSGSVINRSQGIVKMLNVNTVGRVQGTVTKTSAQSVSGTLYDPDASYQKVKPILYVFEGDNEGKTDVSSALQKVLNEAGKTGGVVYIGGGYYLLNNYLTVPAGVELRGSAGAPGRDQGGVTKGTVLLAAYGDGSDQTPSSRALITLGSGAGVNGLRIVYHKNGPSNGADIKTSYAIRGNGDHVYCVNCAILGAAYGIDFSGCDHHYIKKLCSACYYNVMKVGGDNGVVEGCLQNGTVMQRIGSSLYAFCENWITGGTLFSDFFEPITRPSLNYLIITEGNNQTVYHTFAYGPYDFLTNQGGENAIVFNVGSDNIGGIQTKQTAGSMTVIGALRYNGSSYKLSGGSLNLYIRLTINDKTEEDLELVYHAPGEGGILYSVKPNIAWATDTKSTTRTFTMGNSTNQYFKFDPVDLTGMQYIEFDLYISDITNYNNLTKNSEFEISSAGIYDKEETMWNNGSFLNGQTIVQGWNHIKVPLKDFTATDKTAVNWIRWYWVEPQASISGCKIANFRFTADGSVEPS